MRGRVEAVTGKTVTIGPETGGACFGCMNRECRTGDRFYRAENPGALTLLPGQIVETGIRRGALASQTLMVLFPPVLGFIAGFLLSLALTGRENLGVLGGLPGFFLAALGVYLIRRRFPPRTIPGVLRIVGPEGTDQRDAPQQNLAGQLSHSADKVIL